ncbi:uncharacterized protein KY384_000129 [Bacidia gigantensis]|uniref:uncharacterized protein n=1 Tax=Bacidia gigantensis TaxID=2732470 RepID=UPI001D05AEDB|nr:uncharacterized protein KY384_000129 [Bacidia gigantensis]KAG8526136.1 hypothetical protein KY384_000129 [Bacidia gigantensis]
MSGRPSTPPAAVKKPGVLPRSPLTPEQVKQIEINRLKAKALREQSEASRQNGPPSLKRSGSSNIAAGQKRPYSAITPSNLPSTVRDARNATPVTKDGAPGKPNRPLDDIQPSRTLAKNYIEYDFSKMTDTKGGFMTAEDDPHNKALHTPSMDEKPAHMTMKEWERHQLLRKLRDQKTGPFEPGLSVLKAGDESQKCRECSTMEIDWKWLDVFRLPVCNACKEKYPDKYSLLTKTEAREDYLLTDPELKDEELLPWLERPNPHKHSFHPMMLFLRCQVEDYAFSEKKWGSGERLDEEFAKREGEKKRRKEKVFRERLRELKKKTRTEAWRRGLKGEGGKGKGFGEVVGGGGKHEHVWGRPVDGDEGVGVKTCIECGMEVEELEF